MAFYYGELLWTLENWKDAAEQYTKVVEMNPKGKYVKDAAYAAVLAWKNALNVDDHEQKAIGRPRIQEKFKGKNKFEPMPIPEYQKKMIAAFDTYIKYVPDAPELVVIKYRKARIYYEYNHFDEAAKLFQDIVEKHPNHELAIYSANLLLDSLNAQGKTKEVVTLVDKFLEMPNLMKDPEFGKQMISLKSDTYDIEGHEYEKQKNFKECARSFAGRRRGAARSPEARRAALERGPVLPERAPRRPGPEGAPRSSSRRTRRIRWRRRRSSAWPPATTSWPTTRRRPRTTRTSPTSSRARRRRPTRSATRPPSASASARATRRSPTWTRS